MAEAHTWSVAYDHRVRRIKRNYVRSEKWEKWTNKWECENGEERKKRETKEGEEKKNTGSERINFPPHIRGISGLNTHIELTLDSFVCVRLAFFTIVLFNISRRHWFNFQVRNAARMKHNQGNERRCAHKCSNLWAFWMYLQRNDAIALLNNRNELDCIGCIIITVIIVDGMYVLCRYVGGFAIGRNRFRSGGRFLSNFMLDK